jgi:hypothetical protein
MPGQGSAEAMDVVGVGVSEGAWLDVRDGVCVGVGVRLFVPEKSWEPVWLTDGSCVPVDVMVLACVDVCVGETDGVTPGVPDTD